MSKRNKKWYQASPGQTSATRVMAVPGFYICVAAAIGCTVRMILPEAPDLAGLVIIWLGLAGGCLTGKIVQKKPEVQEGLNESGN